MAGRRLRAVRGLILGSAALALAFTAPAFAAPEGSRAQRSEAAAVRLTGDNKSTAFELDLTEGVTVEVFTLAEPYRVVVDLPDVTFRLPPGTGNSGQGLVRAFRYGLFAEGKGRVVIDTAGPVLITSAVMTGGASGGRRVTLKVSLIPTDAKTFGAGTGATLGAHGAKSGAKPPIFDDTAPPVKKRTRPVVIIDPGHGGIDPGALGSKDVVEKNVVLAVANQLKTALETSRRYDVKMTRTKDVFISLDRRLKFSYDNAADLFISLHADSIEERSFAESVRGATVYTLSERASDEQARLKAEKENASDLVAGLEIGDQEGSEQVKSILIDLMKRETSNFSADFSNVLVGKLGKSITMARDPQRSAAFKVLKQTHAPSVLVELGYISNSADAGQMTTTAWQKQAAGAIAAAVEAYFARRTAEHP